MATIKFQNKDAVFFATLRERIDNYFTQHNISTTGNYKLYIKTAVLISSLVILYYLLVFAAIPFLWVNIGLCMILGVNFAAIGFNLMHDGCHGSYSKIKWVNELMGYSLNILGGNKYLWKQKHNINHHSYTNVEGMDDDIDLKPFIRIHNDQQYRSFHRFQHIYGLFLYGLTFVFWIWYRDYLKYFTGKIAENTPLRKMSLGEHFNFWISKAVHISIFLVVPVVMVGWIPTIVGYLIMSFTTGIVLAIVFQLAHIVGEADFVAPAANSVTNIESEWAVHQVNTTVNFATNNKFLCWLLGGLNFQVEHHLFPRISHIHYPQINKLIIETCKDFNIKYKEFPTMRKALYSHIMHLKQVGAAA